MAHIDFSPAWIRERIARIPRVAIALTPTPLHPMPRLERILGGPRLFIKRDDLTGVALGGNKLRNLEFRLGYALREQPDMDTVIVGLDLQSNSARQTVGASNKLGLHTHLVLVGHKPGVVQGNLLCNYVLGADVHFVADAQEQTAVIAELMRQCTANGRKPHNLSANPMFDIGSALAYIETTLEIQEQLLQIGIAPTDIYMSSSGKGQAGIVLAQRLTGDGFRMHGITATSEFHIPSRTVAIANDTARLLELDLEIGEDEIENDGRFVGPGYGVPSEASIEAVRLFARSEGILLDPIYTGKAAAGMISHVREGRYGPNDVLVFVHTGGAPALFTWNEAFLTPAQPEIAFPTNRKEPS